ncbi:galactose oxidase early set domain-containing protein [Asanoa sp. NPDC049518]|uniref:galactose oxidase early set domain-containing protein n=1 Tax=unclassified Asanoa TaxID=2685164 RepID=UPI0034255633
MHNTEAVPMFSPELRRGLGRLLALTLLLTAGVFIASPAQAAANLVQNPGVEQIGADGFPTCWERSGQGDNTYTLASTAEGRTGKGLRVAVTRLNDGDRKAMMTESAQCAPRVTAGKQYDLSVWYKSTTAANAMTLFRHDKTAGWQYWMDPATLPATNAWTQKTVRTPPVPANTDQVTWGVSVYGIGTLTTDDYSMTEVSTAIGSPTACTDANNCIKGKWQVMPYESTVRGIHSVVLHNGKVLLVAGSGNDPNAFAAGTFKTAVYDPANGSFTNVATPVDLFCSGHVQLADGRVLVMGGNKDYPSADGTVGYKGLKNSYLFDPATNKYTRTNDMLAGHWYPSATMLGNGDIISLGGLGEDSTGTTTTDYYSAAQQKWLPMDQVKQTWAWWGLYPSMVLMQDGRLFYTGSHTFGNGLPGTGASIYNYGANTITDVPGLQNKDERDQSMSVMLPPAQAQRVLTVGGGNGDTGATAGRLTDIIDLKAANPRYTAGPLIPQGKLTGGVPQTGAQGKMYVSLVLLPDGTVFETGGALHNRADPVFEASIFDPATNTFKSGMATDPVPRTYHSSAFLLPDGRVMAVGDNPGNGSFDTRISIYSPPYLFKGARPQIKTVTNTNWAYGSTQRITTNGAITRASLIRPAAVTHSSDPNQRFVELPLTVKANNAIDLNVTNNPNVAPPGWYMLFVHNAKGIPSVAKWVKLG